MNNKITLIDGGLSTELELLGYDLKVFKIFFLYENAFF